MKNTAARKPIPEEIDRRLRNVVLARWLLPGVPVSATLAMWVAVAPGVGEFLQGSLLMLLPVVWMVRFIRHRLNPQVWPNSAAGGGVMVTFVGGPLPLLLFAPLNAGYFLMTMVLGPVVVGGVLWAIAKAMSRYVLGNDPDALIDTPFPLTYRATGDRQLRLTVTTTEVSFERRGFLASNSSTYPHATMPLEVVEVLRLGPVEEKRKVLFDGSDRWPVAVGPGTALRIGFGRPERDWIFPTDQGEHLARLIQGRMAANA
ncbi:hypothetical protein ACOBQX_13675 [Actinokineospora sp. G85]|uniref:hypothetical protein n=1 Tax=Actinokineospora sp. G85 TaxID=3406626 RepID=UPI003C7479E6